MSLAGWTDLRLERAIIEMEKMLNEHETEIPSFNGGAMRSTLSLLTDVAELVTSLREMDKSTRCLILAALLPRVPMSSPMPGSIAAASNRRASRVVRSRKRK